MVFSFVEESIETGAGTYYDLPGVLETILEGWKIPSRRDS
jgi:hypothetical protein